MWLHDIPQAALAAAVATLGVVILLELRSFKQLRRSVDINLGRVFEQLEKLRAESRQLLEAQALAQQAVERSAPRAAPVPRTTANGETNERPMASPESERPMIESTAVDFLVAPPIVNPAHGNADVLNAQGLAPAQSAASSGLPAGEARLLASMAVGRARRDQASAAASEDPTQ
jgi:hypothetical protein